MVQCGRQPSLSSIPPLGGRRTGHRPRSSPEGHRPEAVAEDFQGWGEAQRRRKRRKTSDPELAEEAEKPQYQALKEDPTTGEGTPTGKSGGKKQGGDASQRDSSNNPRPEKPSWVVGTAQASTAQVASPTPRPKEPGG